MQIILLNQERERIQRVEENLREAQLHGQDESRKAEQLQLDLTNALHGNADIRAGVQLHRRTVFEEGDQLELTSICCPTTVRRAQLQPVKTVK